MAGPNLELFKFSLYLFFPLAIMIHYGDPQWYHDNVYPIRHRFWPEEESLYKPPRNSADLKAELAELQALRLINKERREKGLPPLPPSFRTESSSAPKSVSQSTGNEGRPSLRDGASLGTLSMKEIPIQPPAQRTRTWRETWKEATEGHVV